MLVHAHSHPTHPLQQLPLAPNECKMTVASEVKKKKGIKGASGINYLVQLTGPILGRRSWPIDNTDVCKYILNNNNNKTALSKKKK